MSEYYSTDFEYPVSTHAVPRIEDPLPSEVMLAGMRARRRKYVDPPGGDQTQPVCFGGGQLLIPDRPQSERLCSICMSLGRLENTHWEGIDNFRKVIVDHHHSFDALLKSAREGCHLCVLLLTAWEEDSRLDQDPGGGWVCKSWYDAASLNGGIRLKFERVRTTIHDTGVILDEVQSTILCGDLLPRMGGRLICKAMETDTLALPDACLPSGNDTTTGSSASLSRIKAWLKICRSSHPACSQTNSPPPPLPTRVIAVGKKGSRKCYLLSGKERSGYYATLSHCWGDPHNRPLSTTDRTLPCRQRGIEDEALPKTFRHAIQVCRELDIEYIWIDSLCIIQEQETQEDWAKEAPRMGLVYGNSILNISAAAAADSTEGCFRERLGLISWPCPTVLFGKACCLFRYPTEREESLGDPGDTGPGGSSSFLARRAWVLQEQVLSRRSVMFAEKCLIWRCPSLSTNEKYPLGIPHAPNTSADNYRLLHCILNGITSSISKSSTVDIYACWHRTVVEYTSRRLTYMEDRLPAIAGIAKMFGVAVNDSYHAGLWRSDMVFGLLWNANNDKGTAKSARAPSWSWASIDGHVNYSHFLLPGDDARRAPLSPLIDILDVSDPATCEHHPFGVRSRATLSLSGVLLAVVHDKHEVSGIALVENRTRFADDFVYFLPDVLDSDGLDRGPLVCLPVCVSHSLFHGEMRDNGERNKISWKRSLETGDSGLGANNMLQCLILQTIEGSQDTYRRVGLWMVGQKLLIECSKLALFGERRSMTII